MPTTLTLKGIPPELYERIRLSAQAHHRSLNSEVIACLESLLSPVKVTAAEQLAAVRALRKRLDPKKFDHDEIDALKRQGRP